ncbi:D-alanyl-D-alanine carboxypeptidase [Breoghania corrubedonensis]|uniref:D-alanyl-D-alanine carboxypeptidase n=1 Tax=Breoghania corrubedonensis TaxID=665038 RepID=A0A2T5VCL1_9HYPH|nr:D-alanyl-D-alanine carboxypeptidase [Breoghania corrubedonensis]PTW61487.1 D-alanyl-D-alanine carboxypeptidase [Breoghania corrubedonensis]
MHSRNRRSATLSTLIRSWAILCIAVAATLAAAPPASANSKYSGIVVDAKTGKVLYSNHANSRRYPASLTKIMTLYILFEELEAGRMSLNTPLKASRHSSGMPPSKVGLRPGETIKVRDAIGALVTKSANDVAATVGENIAGSEPAFARRMTRTAHQLGMRSTQFRNASGLPNSNQYTTAADMARLARAIQERFPTYYKYFSTRVFTYKGRRYGNHNHLLGRVKGVDGIKTGYIRASGFNLVTSVRDKGRHIVAVVFGGRTGRSRDAQMRQLIAQYLPKASTGSKRDSIVIARKAPLPSAKPGDPDPAPIVVAEIPLPPVLAGDTADDETTDATDDLVPPALAEGDADAESTIETASILPAPKAIDVAIARAHAIAHKAEITGKPGPKAKTITVATAPADAAAVPERPAGWHVQIAAAPTEAGALAMLKKAQEKAAGTLKGRKPFTEAIQSGGQTLYRARFAGFPNQDAAVAACKSLKRAKVGCYATQ